TIAHAWVEYGQDTLNLRRARMEYGGQAVCHDIEHKVRLEGLQPGGKYFYRVCAQEILHYAAYSKVLGDTQVTDFYSFQLPEEGQEDFTALIFNDLHRNPETIRLMSELAGSIPHDFVLFNGDCIPDPASREDAMYMLHRLASAFHAEEIPAIFVRGNHEIRNFHSAALPSLLDQPGGKTYGAFSWGDTRFVVLDCGEDKPDDHPVYYGLNDFSAFRRQQYDFLQEEMESREFRKAERRVLVSHIPLWGNGDKYRPCSELWVPLLEDARFDVALSGHTHRFRYHSTGDASNSFPVCIGGGPGANSATMMVLTKNGKDFSLRALNTKGEELGAWSL
ncbi:MAG: FN3 domain-containing metallophosphoesterase family protein, partial [Bacteroidaceae bacterium]|nr:FN3 domain-containing metallophosphoesterase family protein [Bacteroidaceae bacterium]